ncbi:hypothetical protein THRCLA_06755 [Thraustotheca clavata]|uniref:Uncharacterized protein n=1 Tax=Thraustotheca clavata TaxID=74557 RepID=A0A1V9ZJX0_9STRA|nr:hypothetical protein THRCLA_06755 [Thraustotheca clavata]
MQEVVLGALHKQHATAREAVLDICTRLVAKDEALRETMTELSMLKKEFEIRDTRMSEERKGFMMEIKQLKQNVQEKEKILSEMEMEKKLALDEIRVLKTMNKEREEFIAKKMREMQISMCAMGETTKKYESEMDDISRQKKIALEQLEQTRANCKYLDDYMTDIAKTIEILSKEVQTLEENQKECESLLVGKNNPKDKANFSAESNKAMVESLCEQVGSLQSQMINYETKIHELEKVNSQLLTDKIGLETHLQELQLDQAAQSRLVTKYQESSVCGTQTIDALQESITSICAQNDIERDDFIKQIEALSTRILELQQIHLIEINQLQENLITTQQKLQEKEIQLEEEVQSLCLTPISTTLSPVLTATSTATCQANIPNQSDMCLSCHEAPFESRITLGSTMMLSNILDSNGSSTRRKVPVHLDIDTPYPSWSTPSPSSSIVSNGTTEDSSSGDEFVPHRPNVTLGKQTGKKNKARSKGSEQSNKEFRREYKKEWYEKNREKALAKMKEYYERRKQAGTLHRRTNKSKKTNSVESSPASSCADEPMGSPANMNVLPRQAAMPSLFIHEDMPQFSPSTRPFRPRFNVYEHPPQFTPMNPYLTQQDTPFEYTNFTTRPTQAPAQNNNNNHLNLLCHVALME